MHTAPIAMNNSKPTIYAPIKKQKTLAWCLTQSKHLKGILTPCSSIGCLLTTQILELSPSLVASHYNWETLRSKV